MSEAIIETGVAELTPAPASLATADEQKAGTAIDAGATAKDISAPPEKAAEGPSKTIAEADPAPDEKLAAGDWPDDWREKLAGDDEKMLSRLKRFQSPANVLKSWRELELKVTSDKLKKGIDPSKASPEEVAAWRKENGIPDTAKDYKLDLGGIVPPEHDKPILDGFKEFAHGKNWTPDQVNDIARWYYETQEQQQAAQIAEDKSFRGEAVEELRGEWGAEYRSNLNSIKNYAQGNMPEDLFDRFMGARLADGRLLGDDPGALRWLAQIAAEQSPGAALMPVGTTNIGKGVDARIAEIEHIMSTDSRAYWQDGRMQTEFAQLLEAREKMKSRAA